MPNTPAYEIKVQHAVLTLGEAIEECGYLVAIDTTTGAAYKASDAANRRVVGVNVDVTSTGIVGDKIVVKAGIYLFKNSATGALTKADIGENCYVETSSIVSSATGTNSVVAGKVADVDPSGLVVVIVG